MRWIVAPLARSARASLGARLLGPPPIRHFVPNQTLQTVSAANDALRRRDPSRYEGAVAASNSHSSGAEAYPTGRRPREAEVLDEEEQDDSLAEQYTAWDNPEDEDEINWAEAGDNADYYGVGADAGFEGPVGRSLRRLSPAARHGLDKRGMKPTLPWGFVGGLRHLRHQIPLPALRQEMDLWKLDLSRQLTNHQYSAPREEMYLKRQRSAAGLVSYFLMESPARYIAIHGVLSTLKKRLAAETEEARESLLAAGVPEALHPKPFKPTRLVEWDCAGAEGAWAFSEVFDPPPKPEWAEEEMDDPTAPYQRGTWPDHESRHPRVRSVEDALEYWGATGDVKRMNVAADMMAQSSSWETMRAWRGKISRFDTWGRSHSPPIHTHMYDRLIATLTYRPTKPSRIIVPKKLFKEIRRAERDSGLVDSSRPSDRQYVRDTARQTEKNPAAAGGKEAAEADEEADEADEAEEEETAQEQSSVQDTVDAERQAKRKEKKLTKRRQKRLAETMEDDPDETPEERAEYEAHVGSSQDPTLPHVPEEYPDSERLSQANEAAMQGELEGDNITPDKDTVLMSAFRLSYLKSDQERVDYVTRMWKQKWADVFVLVEQADPRGFAAIASARSLLLRLGATTTTSPDQTKPQDTLREGGEELTIDGETFYEVESNAKPVEEAEDSTFVPEPIGSHIVAPCPHDKPCPLLHPFATFPEVNRTNLHQDLQSTRAICRFHNTITMPREHGQLLGRKRTNELRKDYTYIIVRRGSRPNVDAVQEAARQEVAAAAEREAVQAAFKASEQAESEAVATSAVEPVPDIAEAAAKTKAGEIEYIRRQSQRDLAATRGEEAGATHILTEAQLKEAVARLENDEEEASEARETLDSLLPSVVQHLRQQNPEAYGQLTDEDVADLVRQMQGELHTPPTGGELEPEPQPKMTAQQKSEAAEAEAQYYRDTWPEEAAFLDEEFPDQNQSDHQPNLEEDGQTVKVDMPAAQPGRPAITPPPDLGPLEYAAMRIESYSWPRLLVSPRKKGGHVLMYGCTSDGNIKRFVVGRRNVQQYQDARKSRQGDLFPYIPSMDDSSTLVERARANKEELATPAALAKRTKSQATHLKKETKRHDDEYDVDREDNAGTDTMHEGLDDEQVEQLLELERLTDFEAGLTVPDDQDPFSTFDPYASPRQRGDGTVRERQKPATLKQLQSEDPEVAAYGAIGPDAMAIVNKERLAPVSALVTPVHGDNSYLPSVSAGLTLRSRKARDLKRKQTLELYAHIDPAHDMPELEQAAQAHREHVESGDVDQKLPYGHDSTAGLPRDKDGNLLRTHHKVHLNFHDDDPEAGFRALEAHRRRASRPTSMGSYDLGMDELTYRRKKKA